MTPDCTAPDNVTPRCCRIMSVLSAATGTHAAAYQNQTRSRPLTGGADSGAAATRQPFRESVIRRDLERLVERGHRLRLVPLFRVDLPEPDVRLGAAPFRLAGL